MGERTAEDLLCQGHTFLHMRILLVRNPHSCMTPPVGSQLRVSATMFIFLGMLISSGPNYLTMSLQRMNLADL